MVRRLTRGQKIRIAKAMSERRQGRPPKDRRTGLEKDLDDLDRFFGRTKKRLKKRGC